MRPCAPNDGPTTRPDDPEAQLRRRIEQSEAENAYLKTAGLEKRAARIKTQIIAILKSDHRLADLLKAAGLARSTYFYHLQRLNRPDKHADLKAAIQAIFTANQQRYGYRRMLAVLRNQGWMVNHKLVFTLMDQMGLKSKVRRRTKYTSYTRAITHSADNILDRHFAPDHPNAVWVSDVAEFRVAGRKVYLSPVMDLYDRSILAYELSTSPSTMLTATSLRTALEGHQPGRGLMVHTDRGVQYHHFSWRRLIEQSGAVQSMSRKGNCYDNAVMENFFGHLKAEMYYGEHFASLDEFSLAIDRYIAWYNNDRVQERIAGLAPRNTGVRPLQPPSRRIKPVQLSGASSRWRGNSTIYFAVVCLQE